MKQRLLTEGPRFSYVQALRLLRSILAAESGGEIDARELDRRIHVRPELSLAYPESDIIRIEELPGKPPRYSIETTFLGLYGAASPLPTFYTEDLLHERADGQSVTRDFLDILNAPLYRVYFGIWSKYRLFHCLVEHPDPDTLQRLFALLGLSAPVFRERVEEPYGLLRYIGLVIQVPRSAAGLRSLLADFFREPSFRVEQCVPRVAGIPEDQRCILGQSGNCLGKHAYLGTEILDRMGKFRVRLEMVESETFHRFLPDRPDFTRMSRLVRFYLDQPFDWDVEFVLCGEDIQPVRLGDTRWSQLGWNSWAFSERVFDGPVTVTVNPPGAEFYAQ